MRRCIANEHNHGGTMPKTYVHTALGGPETQEFLDLPVPVPAEGQILIKVRAAGVNPADWKRRSNFSGTAAPAYDGCRQLYRAECSTLLFIRPGGGVGIAAARICIGEGVKVIGTAS